MVDAGIENKSLDSLRMLLCHLLDRERERHLLYHHPRSQHILTLSALFSIQGSGPIFRLPWWLRWQRICLQCRRPGFDPWVRKKHWRREQQPTPVFSPGKFHGQRSLAGYNPWSCKELDTTEWLILPLPDPVLSTMEIRCPGLKGT